MIEVFKTNVQLRTQAEQIIDSLALVMSKAKINFDLEDCDKILRVEGTTKSKNRYIIAYLTQLGYNCEILE